MLLYLLIHIIPFHYKIIALPRIIQIGIVAFERRVSFDFGNNRIGRNPWTNLQNM